MQTILLVLTLFDKNTTEWPGAKKSDPDDTPTKKTMGSPAVT